MATLEIIWLLAFVLTVHLAELFSTVVIDFNAQISNYSEDRDRQLFEMQYVLSSIWKQVASINLLLFLYSFIRLCL
jgi:hypothetical protein